MFFWVLLGLGGIWLILQIRGGQIKSPFEAPPAPTRTSTSYALEGDAQFTAGNIDKSISAYQEAVRVDPNNAQGMGRAGPHPGVLLVAADDRRRTGGPAGGSAEIRTDGPRDLAPDDSTAHAVLAFALDWNADASLFDDDHVQAIPDAGRPGGRARACSWMRPTRGRWPTMPRSWWTSKSGPRPSNISSRPWTAIHR